MSGFEMQCVEPNIITAPHLESRIQLVKRLPTPKCLSKLLTVLRRFDRIFVQITADLLNLPFSIGSASVVLSFSYPDAKEAVDYSKAAVFSIDQVALYQAVGRSLHI